MTCMYGGVEMGVGGSFGQSRIKTDNLHKHNQWICIRFFMVSTKTHPLKTRPSFLWLHQREGLVGLSSLCLSTAIFTVQVGQGFVTHFKPLIVGLCSYTLPAHTMPSHGLPCHIMQWWWNPHVAHPSASRSPDQGLRCAYCCRI